MPFAIKVEGLAKEWSGKPLFQHVDFEITDGERVALFGRNGVGKTTLIRCLMGPDGSDQAEIVQGVRRIRSELAALRDADAGS